MNFTYRRTRHALLLLTTATALIVGCSTVVGSPLVAGGSPTSPDQVEVLGLDDGYLRDGETLSVVDDVPAVTNLGADLRSALRDAASDAERAGFTLRVNSGWRSRAYQQWMLDEAIRTHGSYQEARRWVATPDESRHTTGAAVDIGPPPAAAWLEENGGRWGLCRVFDNEPWHFELVGVGGVCPALVPDATQ